MRFMDSDIRVIEKEKPVGNATLVLAFPDVGLVGPIAVKHLVKTWDMKEIGYCFR